MPERPIYCLPVDVLRKFDPTATQSDLTGNNIIGNEDLQQVRARIDAVCANLEDQTGHAFRRGSEGAPDNPETYEHRGVDNKRSTAPLWTSLKYRPVLPFDSTEGDRLEVRTGKDSWEDVTGKAGDEFALDHRTGRLKLYRWIVNRVFWNAPDDRFVRASYRYGALGGSQFEGGQTTLDGSITSGDTSATVADAARLPDRGIVSIANDEYARITGVDYGTNTLTLSRGEQVTGADSHDDGDVIHYCPANVRDAVAAKTARELVLYDNFIDRLIDTGDGIDAQSKLEQWETEWTNVLAANSEVRKL